MEPLVFQRINVCGSPLERGFSAQVFGSTLKVGEFGLSCLFCRSLALLGFGKGQYRTVFKTLRIISISDVTKSEKKVTNGNG